MELREYLKILKKNIALIVITTVLVAIFAYVFTAIQPTAYEASESVTIIPKPSAELKNVYEYSGYYALQAANLFGNTIASWFQNPDMVAEVYQKAGYEIDKTQTSKSLTKLIKATVAPNSFAVKFQLKDRNKDKAEKLARATITVVQNKTLEFNQKAGPKINFEIAASEPVIIEVKPKIEFNTLIGGLAGLVLGIFLAFVVEYFRKS